MTRPIALQWKRAYKFETVSKLDSLSSLSLMLKIGPKLSIRNILNNQSCLNLLNCTICWTNKELHMRSAHFHSYQRKQVTAAALMSGLIHSSSTT